MDNPNYSMTEKQGQYPSSPLSHPAGPHNNTSCKVLEAGDDSGALLPSNPDRTLAILGTVPSMIGELAAAMVDSDLAGTRLVLSVLAARVELLDSTCVNGDDTHAIL